MDWQGERSIPYKSVENLSLVDAFYNLEGKSGRKSQKRTISASGRFESLQGDSVSGDKVFEFVNQIHRHFAEAKTELLILSSSFNPHLEC